MRITKQQFLDRFTAEEMAGILGAAKVSPSVDAWLFRFNAVTPEQDGTSIDTKDERTIAGIHALEAAGLLAVGRAAAILELGKARVLSSFAELFPDEYEIVSIRADGTATLLGIGDFASGFYERIV